MSSIHYETAKSLNRVHRPTSIMTDTNQNEVRCGMCARELYVDDEDYPRFSEAIISGSENPFRCEVCEEYDETSN